ncbi:MAG: NAD(P)/FAD-dependent oxidoreductase [candidate division Zixibacteria bacterium]|nr:NAD(P)/FAD-dependent oxidoreductase [candidate division Zixibacteria bacterium]
MIKNRVIVIGAGAAGLMAAGQSALSGAKTLILEKKGSPGCKLSITGKGRCNLTNIAKQSEFIARFGRNGNFLRQAFSRFYAPELIEFFEKLGVPTVTERGGRVFPVSDDANDIVNALTRWAIECGAALQTKSPVQRLLIENNQVIGVEALKTSTSTKGSKRLKKHEYNADAVIIAAGGASYPGTGSTGDGFRLAEAVGHTIVPIRPALIPLETAGDTAPKLQGLQLKNVMAKVFIDRKKRAEEFGEMIFTHFGISGPIILTLSKQVVDALNRGGKVAVSIDLKPALDEHKLEARLIRDINTYGKKIFKSLLKGLLPSKLIPVCLNLMDIAPDKLNNQITASERKRLKTWLKDFRLEITGYRPLAEAIITAGGVSTREVDPRTMASRLVKGLYFAGETLDIDADTGGYNLQAAFSTGWLAGHSIDKCSVSGTIDNLKT